MVGDDVVQLAGDPGALLGHRPPGLAGLLALQADGPFLELGGEGPLQAGPVAQDPGPGEGQRAEGGCWLLPAAGGSAASLWTCNRRSSSP